MSIILYLLPYLDIGERGKIYAKTPSRRDIPSSPAQEHTDHNTPTTLLDNTSDNTNAGHSNYKDYAIANRISFKNEDPIQTEHNTSQVYV